MIVGYARTSTDNQVAGLEAQERLLREVGCERVFSEQVSAISRRDRLQEALRFVREGDVLVATKPDRIARSTRDLLDIVDQLTSRGIGLRILSMGGMDLDTQQPTSRLMLAILGAVAQFERELSLERQRFGILRAAQEGKYKGRAPTARRQAAAVWKLKEAGVKPVEIARQLNISRASVYRILRDLPV